MVFSIFEIEKNKKGPRLRIAGQRVHHGASSIIATGVLLSFHKTRIYAPLLLLAAVHDRRDWKFWFAPGDPAARSKFLKRKN